MQTNKKLIRALYLYLSSAILYGGGILLFHYFPYYQKTLNQQTQKILLYLYLGFLILSPLYYLIFSTKYSTNKPLLFFQGIKNLINKFKLEQEQKVAFLFILVKLFFLPLMINFFIANSKHLLNLLNNFNFYAFALTFIFTLDTLIFAFGYTFEFKSIKNVVKSVEPTLFGWIVALICYPPFNLWMGKYVPWGASNFVMFWNPTITTIMRVAIIFFLVIYVWASIALGPKASNLTNRGIVTRFPYSVIRHPAYISKNLVWWLTLLPVLGWQFALGMLIWSIIYYFRASTEEKHLSQDPDYVKYCQKVKWKFIPFVY